MMTTCDVGAASPVLTVMRVFGDVLDVPVNVVEDDPA